MINPLRPKSDQHEISPYNSNALENTVVMRIEVKIREDEMILIDQQILPTTSIENVKGQ